MMPETPQSAWTSQALHEMTIGAIEDVKARVIDLTTKVDAVATSVAEMKGAARARAATVATGISLLFIGIESLIRRFWG